MVVEMQDKAQLANVAATAVATCTRAGSAPSRDRTSGTMKSSFMMQKQHRQSISIVTAFPT